MDPSYRWTHQEGGPEKRDAVIAALVAGDPDWWKVLEGFYLVDEDTVLISEFDEGSNPTAIQVTVLIAGEQLDTQ